VNTGLRPFASLDYDGGMGRLITFILALAAAAAVAMLFGVLAHDDLGIPVDAIRTDALTSAGVIFVLVACGTLLGRPR
jgi:hypothetical protein